jgi:uncharacterized membrane protein YkgB
MNAVIKSLNNSGLFKGDFDYHFIRASMVVIYLFFGYQKWFPYEAKVLVPFISNGPLIWWLYPLFGQTGATWFLGAADWTFGALIFAGFWSKKLGILGAAGSIATFVSTVTIIPFMPGGWADVAGGFPAMAINNAFLLKDLVLLAVSAYLFKEDVNRAAKALAPAPHAVAARA